LPKRGAISSAAYQRYDLQLVVVGQCGLIERFSPHDSGVAFDGDAARVKGQFRQEAGDRKSVGVFGPFAIYLDSHDAIMRPASQWVKPPTDSYPWAVVNPRGSTISCSSFQQEG